MLQTSLLFHFSSCYIFHNMFLWSFPHLLSFSAIFSSFHGNLSSSICCISLNHYNIFLTKNSYQPMCVPVLFNCITIASGRFCWLYYNSSTCTIIGKSNSSSLMIEQVQVFLHDSYEQGCYLESNGFRPIDSTISHLLVVLKLWILEHTQYLVYEVFMCVTIYFSFSFSLNSQPIFIFHLFEFFLCFLLLSLSTYVYFLLFYLF